MDYIITDDFDKATHWIPTNDEDAHWDWTHVTIGKLWVFKLIGENTTHEHQQPIPYSSTLMGNRTLNNIQVIE